MTRTTVRATKALALAGCLLAAGCASGGPIGDFFSPSPNPKPTASRLDAGCEALRPYMPLRYAYPGDTEQTALQARKLNAAYRAACP